VTDVPSTEFIRDFARYQDEAIKAPIRVTSHGRLIGGYLSASDLELFERLKRRDREVFTIEQMSDELLDAIKAAEYGTISR